jgi:hypothetical protein
LDHFLALENKEFLEFTLIEYIQLVYAVLILGSFATWSSDQVINALHIRKNANFELYLNRLTDKLVEVGMTTKTSSSNTCLNHLHVLFEQSKVWYTQVMLDPASVGCFRLGRPEYSFMEILPTLISRCVDFSLLANQEILSQAGRK